MPGNNSQLRKSFAGEWGDQIRRQALKLADEEAQERFQTEARLSYSKDPLKAIRERDSSPSFKLKAMKDHGFSLVSLRTPHIPPEIDTAPPTRQESPMFEGSGRLLSASPSGSPTTQTPYSSHGGSHSALPSSGVPINPRRSTTHNDSFCDYSAKDVDPRINYMNLSRTNSRLLRTGEAPIALGRSGARQEKGVSASGLSGERLMRNPDPRANSFAQRAWLYSDDPALGYKVHGRPTATPIRDLSITLPAEKELDEKESRPDTSHQPTYEQKHYGRKFVFTGDVLSKTGSRRYGVFLDEKEVPVEPIKR